MRVSSAAAILRGAALATGTLASDEARTDQERPVLFQGP